MKTIKIVQIKDELTEEELCEICNEYNVVIEIINDNIFSVYSPGGNKATKRGFDWSNLKYEHCDEISNYEKSRPTYED